ncbi:MAG: thioredoxin family protein [Bacteroidia bacterium]|jgi:thioredoxin-related protein|nr:thioredoxin family protein [Bacteroidia bacterium]MCO5252986.1 DUF255 domain-containing protein [Bacteroidota bacterium]
MIKKISVTLSIALLAALLVVSSFKTSDKKSVKGEEIEWLDFQVGYDKAIKEKKMIIIDVYTDWCGWCKRLDKNTYSKAEIIEKVNKNFIPVKLNPELSAKYQVGDKVMSGSELVLYLEGGRNYGYPTIIFWKDPSKKESIEVAVGYKDAKEFEQMLDFYIGKK